MLRRVRYNNSTGMLRQNAPKAKKKKKLTTVVDAEVQKFLDKAVKDSIHEVDREAVNYMNTKFPDDVPLTFLADNAKNRKKWTMKDFNKHQLDYD